MRLSRSILLPLGRKYSSIHTVDSTFRHSQEYWNVLSCEFDFLQTLCATKKRNYCVAASAFTSPYPKRLSRPAVPRSTAVLVSFAKTSDRKSTRLNSSHS